jgi:NAD(P)-dependent dehydrogenase (short-subunit alcohol dehydrogenase family)
MTGQGCGHIVNTASVAGLPPAPLLTPYTMAKHAVVGLSLSLRVEAAAYGVRVTAACPGVVDTPLLDKAGPEDLPQLTLMGHGREIMRHYQPRFYPADRLAGDILRGMDRNAALVIAPASARVAWRLWRYAPVLVTRRAARQTAWARARFPTRPAEPADAVPARQPVAGRGGAGDG